MAARKSAPRAKNPGDEQAADELVLYIENISDLALTGPSGQGNSVAKNAMRRFRKGTYNPELAVTLFGYLVESGAKRYAKEFGDGRWNEMFDVATRRLAAEQLEEDFRRMAKGGELDHLDRKTGESSRVSERYPLRGPGTDGIYKYRGASIELSNVSTRKWWATIRIGKWYEGDVEGTSSDEVLDKAKEVIDGNMHRDDDGSDSSRVRSPTMNAASRAKPWRTNPLLPGVDQLATAVARLSKNLERSSDGEIDLRLQVFPDGGWELHYGDSGWDPDHSGSWGSSSIPGGTISFDKAHRIADDLLQQVDDQMSEDIEEKPKRTLPPGRNLRASQGVVRSKGKR